jgi:hypothetical protein
MNLSFFQEAYFLRKFYFPKESPVKSVEKILSFYGEVYSDVNSSLDESLRDELEIIVLDCFYEEFYNYLKWTSKGKSRGWN